MAVNSDDDEERRWRRLLAGVVCVLLAPFVLAVVTESQPERVVHDVTLEVTARLAESADLLAVDPDHVKSIVADIVLPHFDFPSLASAVLAEHWQELSGGEQRCVTDGIAERLVERYARALLDYEYTSIVTDSLGHVSRADTVYVTQTAMTPHPQPLSVKYKMEFIDGGWKVVDLIVADVSLAKSYRVSFAEQIEAQGIGDFLRTFPECRER